MKLTDCLLTNARGLVQNLIDALPGCEYPLVSEGITCPHKATGQGMRHYACDLHRGPFDVELPYAAAVRALETECGT